MGKGGKLLILRMVIKGRLRRRLHRHFFQWRRFCDYDRTEEQLVTARNLIDAATQAQAFVAEQSDKIDAIAKQSLAREVEIGKRDGTIEKLEKEKKELQEEVKLAKSYGVDMKRRAAVLGFQVKKFLEMNQNRVPPPPPSS